MPTLMVAFAVCSRSINRVCFPCNWRALAKFTAVVVFPLPPFLKATLITVLITSDTSVSCERFARSVRPNGSVLRY